MKLGLELDVTNVADSAELQQHECLPRNDFWVVERSEKRGGFSC